jgi:hypothetical protein
VPEAERQRALQLGARPISRREAVAMLRAKRLVLREALRA